MQTDLHTPENELSFEQIVKQQLRKNRMLHLEPTLDEAIEVKVAAHDLVNPHNFAYIHNPHKLCDRGVSLLVYIHSSPENLKKRQAVRQTWAQPKLLSLYNATLMFVLGRVYDPAVQDLIDMEAAQYGDILQEDFQDSYRNLTYKGLAGLKWANMFCSKVDFLLKTDDDILVDIVSFMETLYTTIIPSRGTWKKLVLCNVWTRMKVIRDPKSKWYVSDEEFHEEYFPAYCSGSAFLFSGDLIPALYTTALYTPFFWVDDFYVTGLLVNKLKIPHTRLNPAYLLNYNIAEEKLKNDTKELIIVHVKKLSVYLKLWPLIMHRHKGMENYLLPSSVFSWTRNKLADLTTRDNSTGDSEASAGPTPVSINYVSKTVQTVIT
jgi:hypothetical protein